MEHSNCTWDMNQERAFLENLLCQRFNFLFIFYGISIGFLYSVRNQQYYIQLFLFICATLTFLFSLTIYRSQKKLNIILNQYLMKDNTHPVKIIDDEANKTSIIGLKSVRNIIGYVIPTICWGSLFIAFLISVNVLIFQLLLCHFQA